MSVRAFPLLALNLAAEMMYVVDVRLTAQRVALEKAAGVRHELLRALMHPEFVDTLFQDTALPSRAAMRGLFDRVCQSSAMRLSATSLEKLYDLMVMTFKYQLLACKQAPDLLMISLNHIEAMHKMADGEPRVQENVKKAHARLVAFYSVLTMGDWMLLRQTLLAFVQDKHTKISILLQASLQSATGAFKLPAGGPVAFQTPVPGIITYWDSAKLTRQQAFAPAGVYHDATALGSLEFGRAHGTILGENLYTKFRNAAPEEQCDSRAPLSANGALHTRAPSPASLPPSVSAPMVVPIARVPLPARPAGPVNQGAIAALDVLASLVGRPPALADATSGVAGGSLRVNLFDTELGDTDGWIPPGAGGDVAEADKSTVQVFGHGGDSQLRAIMSQFTEDGDQLRPMPAQAVPQSLAAKTQHVLDDGDDLLALMDLAATH